MHIDYLITFPKEVMAVRVLRPSRSPKEVMAVRVLLSRVLRVLAVLRPRSPRVLSAAYIYSGRWHTYNADEFDRSWGSEDLKGPKGCPGA